MDGSYIVFNSLESGVDVCLVSPNIPLVLILLGGAALLGLGFVGFSFGRRRKGKKAAQADASAAFDELVSEAEDAPAE